MLFALAALPLSAGDGSFFPAQTFTLTTGKPQQYSYSFAVPPAAQCDGKAAWIVRVSSDGVTSAFLHLNGKTIASESDFRLRGFEVAIQPAAQNLLTVDLKGGRPGGTLTVAVDRVIELPLGPAQIFTLTGGQEVFDNTYEIPDPSGTFAVTLQNGDPEGNRRIKSGNFSINGTMIVSEDELNSNAALIRRVVTLTSSTTIRLVARGGGGETIAVTLKRLADVSACGTMITITSPAARETVTTATVLVTGEATGPKDSAVTVNGWRAEIDVARAGTAGDPFTWFAEIPASPGPVLLTARLATSNGPAVTAELEVVFAPAAGAMEVVASPRSGVPPLAVNLNIAPASSLEMIRYEVDYDGDGMPEVVAGERPSKLAHTYSQPGQYAITVRGIREDGSVVVAVTRVIVHSWPVMDALLRATWNRFAGALSRGDVDAAVRELEPAARGKYEKVLRSASVALPGYAASLTGIDPVWIHGDAARYLLRRLQNGRTVGYHVYFVRDGDGVWRLQQF